MSLPEFVIAGVILFASGLGLGWWGRTRFSENPPESTDDQGGGPQPTNSTGGVDVEALFSAPDDSFGSLRDLAEEVDDVHELYLDIGFSPVLEDRLSGVRQDLRGQITVEIPDYQAFREALDGARRKMETLREESDLEDGEAPQSIQRAATLLEEVWKRREQPSAVRERLEADPVEEQLPFIERVPVTQSGDLRWRTPARVSVLHKRPADEDQYRQLLDRLTAAVEKSGLSRPENAVEDVNAATDRLRKELGVEDVYVPTLLRRIEEAVEKWFYEAPSSEAKDRKETLDAFLLEVLTLREAGAALFEKTGQSQNLRRAVERFRQAGTRQAREYIETPWIQVPWLTDAVLANLMGAEVLRARQDSEVSTPFRRHLETIHQEIQSRGYDPAESIRRLRVYESEGYFVHSLAFSLLRNRKASSPAASA